MRELVRWDNQFKGKGEGQAHLWVRNTGVDLQIVQNWLGSGVQGEGRPHHFTVHVHGEKSLAWIVGELQGDGKLEAGNPEAEA